MITTGIIREINLSSSNYVGNKYRVELNIFRIPGDQSTSKYNYIANCMVSGGISASLQVGDLVYVGFLNDDKGYPIILGKIYQGLATKPAGHAYFDSLQVDKTVLLPKTTTIGDFSYPELESKFKQLALVQDINSTLVEFSNRIDVEIRDELKPAVENAIAAASEANTAASIANTSVDSVKQSLDDLGQLISSDYRRMIPVDKPNQYIGYIKVYVEGPGQVINIESGEILSRIQSLNGISNISELSKNNLNELDIGVTAMLRDEYGRTQVAAGENDFDAVNVAQLRSAVKDVDQSDNIINIDTRLDIIESKDTVKNPGSYLKTKDLPQALDPDTSLNTPKDVIINIITDAGFVTDKTLDGDSASGSGYVTNGDLTKTLEDYALSKDVVNRLEESVEDNIVTFSAEGQIKDSEYSINDLRDLENSVNTAALYQHSLLFNFSKYTKELLDDGLQEIENIVYSAAFRIDIITDNNEEITIPEQDESKNAENLFEVLLINNSEWGETSEYVYPIRNFTSTAVVEIAESNIKAYFPISATFYLNTNGDIIERRLHLCSCGEAFNLISPDINNTDLVIPIDVDINLEVLEVEKYETSIDDNQEATQDETDAAANIWYESINIIKDKVTPLSTRFVNNSDI